MRCDGVIRQSFRAEKAMLKLLGFYASCKHKMMVSERFYMYISTQLEMENEKFVVSGDGGGMRARLRIGMGMGMGMRTRMWMMTRGRGGVGGFVLWRREQKITQYIYTNGMLQ